MNKRFWGILGLLGLVCVVIILRVGYRAFTSATSQPQPDLSNGLIGYWSFDDTDMSGNMAYDKSGQGHNGTLTNGLQTAVGKIGQALEFDGVSDYVDTGSEFIGTSDATISAWVYARSLGASGFGRIVQGGSVDLKLGGDTGLQFSSDGGVTVAPIPIGSLNLNRWAHFVVSRTSTGVANFYIDGVQSGTANQSSGTPSAGGANVTISGDHPWDSFIDDVRIYNRVLTVDEINHLYTMGR